MNEEFRFGKGYRILITIICAAAVVGFAFGLYAINVDSKMAIWGSVLVSTMFLAFIVVAVFGILDLHKRRLIITRETITSITVFKTTVFRLTEIKGYTIDDKNNYKIRHVSNGGAINVYNNFGNDDLKRWIVTQLQDIAALEVADEENEILSDYAYGQTVAERQVRLNQARTASKVLNFTGYGVGALLIFYPKPFELLCLAAVILPCFMVFALIYFKGLISIADVKESARPSITAGFLVCSLGLMVRGLIEFSIFTHAPLIEIVGVSTVMLAVLIVTITKYKIQKGKDYFGILCIFLAFAVYTYGAITFLNCWYDNSTPQNYQVVVVDKSVSKGKTTTYHLKLAPWGERTEDENVDVSRDQYNATDIGEEVEVNLHEGFFKIRWFYVSIQM